MNFCNFITLLLIIFTAFTSTTTFCKDMIIFGYDSKPPKYYIEDGQSKGILVDIMRWIGKEINYNFDIRLYPWKRAYHHALEGDGGIIGLSWNEERDKIFDYSDVMYFDDVVLAVRKDNVFSFNLIKDLKGKSIALERGSSKGNEFDNLIKTGFLKPVWSNSMPQSLLLVLSGHADMAVAGPGKIGYMMTIYNEASSYPSLVKNRDELTIIPKPIVRDPNYLGISKKLAAHDFLAKFNSALKKGKDSGAFELIIEKYTQAFHLP
ncbi:transporter substrate-binding domain-containing protein [Endozoicomonas sp. SM1973]|uniref:Transporter substrate-binding domain-containing protein n=1 Tax=Spartinivicinus marinus TaxID=2994442 RepID=A0A853I3X7_9GAMM|nr:transporter substrate-binding domain-containing protein [Spartinivicinus marinus]MCX4026246.1 transporter substrate-binding domain-containing protein [Spartinivicinus marinus]NYZ67339.1 transporter substrate-binding domain-containing protein [Spartinivicinus marinus]